MTKKRGKAAAFRRVTVARVRAAYRRTGLRPTRELWADVPAWDRHDVCPVWRGQRLRGEACALGAVAIAETATEALHEAEYPLMDLQEVVATHLGLPTAYVNGFLSGFDGDRASQRPSERGPYRAGYADGQAAAKAMHPAPG